MKFILGTKEYMTQIFDDTGRVHPATVLSAGPLTVTGIRTEDSKGYSAVQVSYGEQKERRINKAQRSAGNFMVTKEFRPKNGKSVGDYKVGDSITASVFDEVDVLKVSGVSKGKGFQGVVKRHNFAGGPRTHGQKHSEREPGSIGATGPQRVFKGTRMAGRMGGDRVTIKNLKILKVDNENNQILVSGAIPGRKGTLIEIVSQ